MQTRLVDVGGNQRRHRLRSSISALDTWRGKVGRGQSAFRLPVRRPHVDARPCRIPTATSRSRPRRAIALPSRGDRSLVGRHGCGPWRRRWIPVRRRGLEAMIAVLWALYDEAVVSVDALRPRGFAITWDAVRAVSRSTATGTSRPGGTCSRSGSIRPACHRVRLPAGAGTRRHRRPVSRNRPARRGRSAQWTDDIGNVAERNAVDVVSAELVDNGSTVIVSMPRWPLTFRSALSSGSSRLTGSTWTSAPDRPVILVLDPSSPTVVWSSALEHDGEARRKLSVVSCPEPSVVGYTVQGSDSWRYRSRRRCGPRQSGTFSWSHGPQIWPDESDVFDRIWTGSHLVIPRGIIGP